MWTWGTIGDVGVRDSRYDRIGCGVSNKKKDAAIIVVEVWLVKMNKEHEDV